MRMRAHDGMQQRLQQQPVAWTMLGRSDCTSLSLHICPRVLRTIHLAAHLDRPGQHKRDVQRLNALQYNQVGEEGRGRVGGRLTGSTRSRRASTKARTEGPIFFTKPPMPALTAKRAKFSGILNCSWCSSTVSQAGRPLPRGHGTVRLRHML